MGTRDELLEVVAGRYRAATRTGTGHILTEFAAISGYHRKHAERLLRREQAVDRSGPRPGRRVYDEAVREALVVLWDLSLHGPENLDAVADALNGRPRRPLGWAGNPG